MSSAHRRSLLVSLMAKVHPLQPVNGTASCCSASSSTVTAKREAFTIWMKSLVMQGNGCTVFNEEGDIVYRMDNYDQKSCREVYLMDFQGRVLVTILQRSLWCFRSWEVYRNGGSNLNEEKPWFQVKRNSSCRIRLLSGNDQASLYKLEGSASKSDFRIVDSNGSIVAEVQRKQSASGVLLGEDVLSLVVEPGVDHSFVIALVTVYGLMNRRL